MSANCPTALTRRAPALRGWGARLVSWLGILLASLCIGSVAEAGEVSIRNPQLSTAEEGITLSAEISVELGNKLEEALMRGLPLYFVQEFEMSRPRWYWFEDKRFSRSQTLRLYYHALTRQYRIGSGPVHQGFGTLEEALAYLTHMRHWLVLDKAEQGNLKAGETYQASLRFKLDSSQLPRPLQINVLFARDWELGGEARWTHTVGEVK